MPTDSPADPVPPLRVIYSGRVQGVGFRWTAARIAQNHAVRGTVKNLSDGTVELCLDGTPTAVAACLHQIAAAMERNIEQVDLTVLGHLLVCEGFTILRSERG